MSQLELQVVTGDALSVRRFAVREAVSESFDVTVVARCANPSLDLERIVGAEASFRIAGGTMGAASTERHWDGICRSAEQTQAEPSGLSTYELRLAPRLWLLTQRRDYRIFQHAAAPDIAAAVLDPWGIAHAFAAGSVAHPVLPYKVQYAESDYAFFCRVLEEAGIAFTFPANDAGRTVLTFGDRLDTGAPRAPSIAYAASPNDAVEQEFVTDARLADTTRPGAYTLRDYDLRRPAYRLVAEADKAPAPETPLEQYQYQPGSFLVDTRPSGDTPVADAQGAARHDAAAGRARAQLSLESTRADKRVVRYRTNVLDLWPGRVFTMLDHPNPALGSAQRLLVTEQTLEGATDEAWTIRGLAVFADGPYHPPLRIPRPRARVQSATVVGPNDAEIHVDELGRARVRFAWDRDPALGCWIRVSQAWAGTGYGMMTLPRVGQEVLVDFLEGNPEQPVIVGRVFNETHRVVEPLPERATRSAWKSNSSPGPGGFNELLLEDRAGSELLYEQAEKDARRLVKHDDTATVVHDRNKLVVGREVETTSHDRVQETKQDHVELTDGDRTTVVGGTRRDRVDADAVERLEAEHLLRVGGDRHTIVAGVQRTSIENDGHLFIGGGRPESVGGTDSLTVGRALQESVGSYTVTAAGPKGWIHLIAGSKDGGMIVIESDADVTVKESGSFIRIDGGGVTIVGPEVVINEGGSPGDLPGPGPRPPERPKIAIVAEPPRVPPDNQPVEIVFDDPFFGPATGLSIDLTFSTGAHDTMVTDKSGTIFVEPARGAWVDTQYDRRGLVVKRRVYLALPALTTNDGAWQRLVNLGYTWSEEPSAPTPADLFRAVQDFQARFALPPTGALDGTTRARIDSAHDDRTPWRHRDWGTPPAPTSADANLKGSLT